MVEEWKAQVEAMSEEAEQAAQVYGKLLSAGIGRRLAMKLLVMWQRSFEDQYVHLGFVEKLIDCFFQEPSNSVTVYDQANNNKRRVPHGLLGIPALLD